MGIKIAAWLWALFDSIGVTTAAILFINLQPVEQGILFCASMVFFGYRVYHLHLDAVRKRLDNESKKLDNEEKSYRQSNHKTHRR